jgi:hypothetical protein
LDKEEVGMIMKSITGSDAFIKETFSVSTVDRWQHLPGLKNNLPKKRKRKENMLTLRDINYYGFLFLFVFVLWLVYPVLPVSLDFPFSIAPSCCQFLWIFHS